MQATIACLLLVIARVGAYVLPRPFALAPRRSALSMSDSNDMSEPDPNFVGEELARTWARTGKGKKLWQPGDRTGDSALDTRLLFSSWVLNPLQLHVHNGLHQESLQAALVVGWLRLPFTVVAYTDAEGNSGLPIARADGKVGFQPLAENGGRPLPRLSGLGVPDSPGGESGDGLQSVSEICSFAAGVAKEKRVAPASGRADYGAWLVDDSATVESLAPLLHGIVPGAIGAPCLNAWGLTVDDALVLAKLVARCEAKQREPDVTTQPEPQLWPWHRPWPSP